MQPPQFARTTVEGILKETLNFTYKVNIQHVSTEFLGNHKIPIPLNFTFKTNNIQHVSTEFLGIHQIRTPVEIYIYIYLYVYSR